MEKADKSNPTKPIYLKLIELSENRGSSCRYSLNMQELRNLFERQAEVDNSGDEPELFPNSVFEVTSKGLHVFTPYTVSNADKPLNRKGLVIEGTVNNNEDGFLSDEAEAEIYPEEIKLGVFEAFNVKERLSMKTYLKSMIEDALMGKVNITNMSLQEEKLVLNFEKGK